MKLSPHFTFDELTFSETAVRLGIDNRPDDPDVVAHLFILATGLEVVRAVLGDVPILLSSGYRSPRLNAAVGGSKNSAHCRGLAADFRAPAYGTPYKIARTLADHPVTVGFDQLIFEGTWVHIGFPAPENEARGEILTAHFRNGSVSYSKGVHA